MRSSELSALREQCGLNLTWIARWTGLPVDILQAFEASGLEIPEGLHAVLDGMNEKMDQLAVQAATAYMATLSDADDQYLCLIEFESDYDFWACEPGMEPYPASFHSALLNRMENYIRMHDIAVLRAVMDLVDYGNWLRQVNLCDSVTSRVSWVKESALNSGLLHKFGFENGK